MKKQTAFTSDFDHLTLYHTARDAREAEFDALVLKIGSYTPVGKDADLFLNALSAQLRSGIYPAAADQFIKAADYLREHRLVLTGAERDPQEDSQ